MNSGILTSYFHDVAEADEGGASQQTPLMAGASPTAGSATVNYSSTSNPGGIVTDTENPVHQDCTDSCTSFGSVTLNACGQIIDSDCNVSPCFQLCQVGASSVEGTASAAAASPFTSPYFGLLPLTSGCGSIARDKNGLPTGIARCVDDPTTGIADRDVTIAYDAFSRPPIPRTPTRSDSSYERESSARLGSRGFSETRRGPSSSNRPPSA